MAMTKDHVTTLGGGAAGVLLLNQVQWSLINQIQWLALGELLKLCAAFALMGLGYLMYRGKRRNDDQDDPAPPETEPEAQPPAPG